MKRRAACATLGSWLGMGLIGPLGADETYSPDVRIKPLSKSTDVVVTHTLPGAAALQLEDGPLDAAVGTRYLNLFVANDESGIGESNAPIHGRYEVSGKQLRFYPRFALSWDTTYVAKATLPGTPPRVIRSTEYIIPPTVDEPSTIVQGVLPMESSVPANILKFYVHFSAPMREGRDVLEQIKLFECVREIGAPWRDLELWDSTATRLSLFLHPGRIKQGVNLREELGPLLAPDRNYTIVIPKELRDARGMPLRKDLRHSFRTTAEVRTPIDVNAWKIERFGPSSSERIGVAVKFDRQIDPFLARRCLRLRDSTGTLRSIDSFQIGGVGEYRPIYNISQHVLGTLRPDEYTLEVDPRLEDVCGNTPLRAFDHDLEQAAAETKPEREPNAVLTRKFTLD